MWCGFLNYYLFLSHKTLHAVPLEVRTDPYLSGLVLLIIIKAKHFQGDLINVCFKKIT